MKLKFLRCLLSISFLIATLTAFAFPVFADVINPEWFAKKCNSNEIEVTCSYSSKVPFGPRTSDSCSSYKLHPDYQFLTAHGSSFGGEEKYCYKASNPISFVLFLFKDYLVLLSVTLPLELSVLWLIRFLKSKNIVKGVILANVISVALLVLVGTFLKLDLLVVASLGEILVFAVEVAVIRLLTKEFGALRLIASVFLANVFSAIVGTLLLFAIQKNLIPMPLSF